MALRGGESGVGLEGVTGVIVEVHVLFGLRGVFAHVVGHRIGGGGGVGAGVVGVTGRDVRSAHAPTVPHVRGPVYRLDSAVVSLVERASPGARPCCGAGRGGFGA